MQKKDTLSLENSTQLLTNSFSYTLPPEKIAQHPIEPRHHAKLLVYRQGKIIHRRFDALAEYLPENAHLILNDTKVIPARLFFQKETGAVIEIFLMKPIEPQEITLNMQNTQTCLWECLIGNKKRWKEGTPLSLSVDEQFFEASIENDTNVRFHWTGGVSFAQILEKIGQTPLPPYMKRKADKHDKSRYQTVYSKYEGAVAAPTAGLHFTQEVFESLAKRQITTDFITLHVGGGTFQPIKTQDFKKHAMHSEQVVFSKNSVKNLLKNLENVIAVGTTSLRSLESLYWFGVKLLQNPTATFNIEKLFPYAFENQTLPSPTEALKAILLFMQEKDLEQLHGQTEIYIFPSYAFKLCKGLITNYHQPNSTLILLIAAFVGENWRQIYEQALQNDYRFLSYGDSSLLLP